MTVEGEINGLYPTPNRRAFLRKVEACDGDIYFEADHVWDRSAGRKVTAIAREAIDHDWIRVATPGERTTAEWSPSRVHYRLTEFGRAAIERGRR